MLSGVMLGTEHYYYHFGGGRGGGGGDLNFGGTNNFFLCRRLCKLCFSNKTELKLAIRQRVYLFEANISDRKISLPHGQNYT